jgi:hypothetical protein
VNCVYLYHFSAESASLRAEIIREEAAKHEAELAELRAAAKRIEAQLQYAFNILTQ